MSTVELYIQRCTMRTSVTGHGEASVIHTRCDYIVHIALRGVEMHK